MDSPPPPVKEENGSPLSLLDSLKKPLFTSVRKRHRASPEKGESVRNSQEIEDNTPLKTNLEISPNATPERSGEKKSVSFEDKGKEEKEETTPVLKSTSAKKFRHPNSSSNAMSPVRKRKLGFASRMVSKKVKNNQSSPTKDYDADDLIDKIIY